MPLLCKAIVLLKILTIFVMIDYLISLSDEELDITEQLNWTDLISQPEILSMI